MATTAATNSRAIPRTTRTEWIVLALCVLGFGLLAMSQGQSNNWDLRNYHWYNGWAWWNDRSGADLAVAQAQSWFNPLLPAALYLLLASMKPWLGTFVLGCLQGLNLLPLHRIALTILPAELVQQRRWLVLFLALVGASGATQRGELGATFGDNLISLPLLMAIALLLARPRHCLRHLGAAGALLGLAVGLKLTVAPFAAGIAVAALCLGDERRDRWRIVLIVGASAAASFLVVNGHWMYSLWQQFGNPLFPLFGRWFDGEFQPPFELRDDRWLPRSVFEWLCYPIAWALNPRRVSELWFLDLRIPLLFLATLALPLSWQRLTPTVQRRRQLQFLLVAMAVAYLLWLGLFGYYRYLQVLEMLAPLLLAVTVLALPLPPRASMTALLVLLSLMALATRPPRWGRARHYSDHYVQVQLPERTDLAAAMVVFGDGEPLGFITPAFPASTRFVRIGGNLIGPPRPAWALDKAVQARLQAHAGPLYLIAVNLKSDTLQQALQRHHLALASDECGSIDSNLFRNEARPHLCRLYKLPAP